MNYLIIQEKIKISFPSNLKVYGYFPFHILFGEESSLNAFLYANKNALLQYDFISDTKNALYPYPDIQSYECRIEKGAIIREGVTLSKTAIILMGAILNKDVFIGDHTMVDMNAVVGSGAMIKNRVHIGAGAIISGIMEPQSKGPVIIEDDVFIGANSVISEGVHIGKGSIIGASSFVHKHVPAHHVVYGVPAKIIRKATEEDYEKLSINWSLRKNSSD